MVKTSRNIHTLTLPRDGREDSRTASCAPSAGAETAVDALCQNSDVAIRVLPASQALEAKWLKFEAFSHKKSEKGRNLKKGTRVRAAVEMKIEARDACISSCSLRMLVLPLSQINAQVPHAFWSSSGRWVTHCLEEIQVRVTGVLVELLFGRAGTSQLWQ
jgi:hypothetical protein